MEIQKYNEDLVSSNTVITILEYVTKLNDKFYNNDISFIDDFLELVDKDAFCIHHDMLMIYGIYKMSSGSNDIKKYLNNKVLLKTMIINKMSELIRTVMIMLIKLIIF